LVVLLKYNSYTVGERFGSGWTGSSLSSSSFISEQKSPRLLPTTWSDEPLPIDVWLYASWAVASPTFTCKRFVVSDGCDLSPRAAAVSRSTVSFVEAESEDPFAAAAGDDEDDK
jgi:hypothetical protein